MSLETANGPVGTVMKFCTIVKFMYAGKMFRNFAKNIPLHITSSFISTPSGPRIKPVLATLDSACNSTPNTQKKHGPKLAVCPNFNIPFEQVADLGWMRGWSHWNRFAILHNLNIIHANKNWSENSSRHLSKILSWYRSQNHRSVPPPYYIKFQFDTFRTSDETRFCHTRSAVKFYTQYTKETRTKTGNVSGL